MLQTKRKKYAPILKNGTHKVFIASISENINGLTLKFSCGLGTISHTMPVNNHLHDCLCKIAYLADIKANDLKLMDFVNKKVQIEIINNEVRYITKYGTK